MELLLGRAGHHNYLNERNISEMHAAYQSGGQYLSLLGHPAFGVRVRRGRQRFMQGTLNELVGNIPECLQGQSLCQEKLRPT